MRLHGTAVVGLALVTGACAGGAGTGAEKPAAGKAPSGRHAEVIGKIDAIINEAIKGKAAGASVAVVKGRDTILVKGYGLANIELDVPTPPRATYEIGSVTKQFTGAAIMQLVSQGKISLDDDLSKHLPDYNAQGRKVTIRRLLDHTSGIKGYTEMETTRSLFPQTLPRDTLVKLFSKAPFDFEPGEEQIYNNSAFFLAGLIIEKLSGMSYEDYVQKNLFDKAGMKDAHYCSNKKIYKNRVTGYDSDSAGPVVKGPMSHLWPYAAGSLCSSAIDLVAWNEALHRDGKILDAAAYKEFITPEKLNDGSDLVYSKGIATYSRVGHRALHHGGGIPGFLSENIYYPDDSLSVVVLFNTSGPASPDAAAIKISEAVLGKPADVAKPIDGDASRFAGVYAGRGRGRPMEVTVAVSNGKVTVKMPFADSAEALVYIGNDTFLHDEARAIFTGTNGKITKLRLDSGYGNNVLTKK